MDWSASLKYLFSQRQIIKNSTNQAEVNQAKKEEKEILSNSKLFNLNGDGKVDIEDLISFSLINKDENNDGNISDEEQDFFDEMKNILYDKLAKDINKNKDLKIDDMMELEKTIRELTTTEKEVVGTEMEKLQNRMASNLTSQFFVTKETASYKENAINGAIEIWEAQNELDEMNVSENNPFNDKFENLLEKLEGRVIRTLSEDYTSASIQDAKALRNPDALVKKSDADEPEYDKSKFEVKSDGFLYYGDEKFTGTYYKDNKYYQQGEILTGVAYKNGHYYDKGIPGDNKAYPNISGGVVVGTFWVENGEIKYEDIIDSATEQNNYVRYYYDSYIMYNEDGTAITKNPIISKKVHFEGGITTGKPDTDGKIKKIENYSENKLVSTETRLYNPDGSYAVQIHYEDSSKKDEYEYHTTTGELFTGTGVYDGKLYKNNAIDKTPQIYGERLYRDGVQATGTEYFGNENILFVNGEKFNGIFAADGKLYVDGVLKPLVTADNGKVYRYGVLAQGVIKDAENNKYYYYVNGEKQSDEVDASFGEFVAQNAIENIILTKTDGKFDYSSFTGVQFLDSVWRNVKYTDFRDENNFKREDFYEYDVSKTEVIENGILTKAEYTIGDNKRELVVDGSKLAEGIDYSLQYVDIDGIHPNVKISNAIGDNLTYVYTYQFSTITGKYGLADTTLVIGSINDIQSGKLLTEYSLSKDDAVNYVSVTDSDGNLTGIKVTDESLAGVKIEQTFGLDGKVTEGKVTFNSPASGVTNPIILESGDSCKIVNGNVVITKPHKVNNAIDKYIVAIYSTKGEQGQSTEVPCNDGITDLFAQKININVSDIQAIDIEDGRVKSVIYEGIAYNVTYDSDKIILKSQDEKYEKIIFNKVVIYEKEPFGESTVTIERYNSGVQKSYRTEQSNGEFSEYRYYQSGKLSKAVHKNSEKQTSTTYGTDGKTVLNVEVIEYNNNKEKSVIRYLGEIDESNVTYKKEYNKDGFDYIETDYANNKILKSKKDGAVETNTTYSLSGNLKGTVITTFKSATSSEISTVVEKDENGNAAQKTTYKKDDDNNNIIEIEKYQYSSVADTVVQTTKETYNIDGVILSSVITDNANNNKIRSAIYYENGIKAKEETIDDYDASGNPKTSTVVEYRNGLFAVRTYLRTYSEYPKKYTDSVIIDGEVTEVGGVTVKQAQRDFAKRMGLTITHIEYNSDGSLKLPLIGIRYDDHRICEYSDWSVSSDGKYSYTEAITYAGDGTTSTEDDVTFISRVVNDEQQYARIIVDGQSYPVNVNGASINDTLDASVSTELIDDKARYVYVSDVLFDGVVRRRVFTRKSNTSGTQKYDKAEYIAFGSLEDLKNSSAVVPQILLPSNATITESVVTITKSDNKIPVYLNGSKAYDITLHSGETFTIKKDNNGFVIEGTYTENGQSVKVTYVFTEDGGYTKTTGTTTETFGPDGNKIEPESES